MIMIIAPMVLIGRSALGILNDGLVDYDDNTLLLPLLLLPVLMMEMLMEELC